MSSSSPLVRNVAYAVWQAFDFLPSAMPTATCQQYLLCLLFLRAVSTLSDEDKQTAHAWQQCGLVVPHEAQLGLLYNNRSLPENAARIDLALQALAACNPALLGKQLAVTAFATPLLGNPTVRDAMLSAMIGHFVWLSVTAPGEAHAVQPYFYGEVFSEVIAEFARYHDSSAKMYTSPQADLERDVTPQPVAQLMAALLDPMAGDSIYDPACGTGSLLLACAQWVRRQHQSEPHALHGQELNFDRCALARMQLVLYGLDSRHVQYGDALVGVDRANGKASESLPYQPSEGNISVGGSIGNSVASSAANLTEYDVVLSAPPITIAALHETGAARRTGFGFVLPMLARLRRDTGRMAVMLPLSALVRGGDQRELRKELLKSGAIDSVILLPTCLLLHYPEAACIVLMRRSEVYRSVYFVDARNLTPMPDQSLEAVIATIAAAFIPKNDRAGLSRMVSWTEIEEANFDFSHSFVGIGAHSLPTVETNPTAIVLA